MRNDFSHLIPQPDDTTPGRVNAGEPQVFPPIASVIERGRGSVPIWGIYCWAVDYPVWRDAIREIGFANLRTGGQPFEDDTFRMICEDGLDTFVTLGKWRGGYESDEEWIRGNIEKALTFLRRYGPGGSFFRENPTVPYHPVTAYEIFNEPNFGYMVPNSTDFQEKVRLYTALQIAEYRAVKAEFPDVRIVGFGAGGASAADAGFIGACLKHDPRMAASMDVLSTHPYMDPVSPFAYMGWLKYSVASGLANIRESLAACGRADLPIWYTECGWFIKPDEGGYFPTCEKGSTKIEQAAHNVQMYLLGLRLGIERITAMYIMDTDNCNPGFVDRRDGSLRPSGVAMKTAIRLLPNPRLLGAIYDGEDCQRFAYRLESEPGGEEVIALFCATRRLPVTIPWNEPDACVTDLLGNTVTAVAENGSLTLDAGPCVLYVRHASPRA